MNKTVKKKILYIGPYLENSLRGSYARNIIKGLYKNEHQIELVPIFNKVDPSLKLDSVSEIIKTLEDNTLDDYDVCIQHCDPNQYVRSNKFLQNIGIYTPSTYDIDPIIYSKLELLDTIIVNSSTINSILSNMSFLNTNIKYCPSFIDEDILFSKDIETLEWIDTKKYYFYTEMDFDEMYDWEKLIYVFFTSFDKDVSLILKTKDLESDEMKVQTIHQQITLLAIDANIKPDSDRMPKIMSGNYKDIGYANLINSIDCYIDIQKHTEPNANAFLAHAMGKAVIANSRSELQNLENIYTVDSLATNLYKNHYDSIAGSSMYHYYYSLDANSLRDQMLLAYRDRINSKQEFKSNHKSFNIENVNEALC